MNAIIGCGSWILRHLIGVLAIGIMSVGISHAVTLPQVPLNYSATRALTMLALSKDHTHAFRAYNDYTDIDNDGELDLTYKNTFAYYGYFDSNRCYTYNSNNKRFEPSASKVMATDPVSYYCPSGQSLWSGNFLNWVTMSRMDIIRRVLYGGKRVTDSTSETVLERTYVPPDAHSWVKLYSGTDIAKLTPFTATALSLCSTTSGSEPQMRVASGTYPFWTAREGGGSQCGWGGDSAAPDSAALGDKNYVVRVLACVVNREGDNCRLYPNATLKKPIGLLQQYGEDERIWFGLMTGSYTKNLSGGVLRKNIGSFGDEVATSTTGIFTTPASSVGGIVPTLDRLRISGFNGTNYGNSGEGESGSQCGTYGFVNIVNGTCRSWGNPEAEIFLEAVRYFSAPSKGATPAFAGADDNIIAGLPSNIAWQDPFASLNDDQKKCSVPSIIFFSSNANTHDNDDLDSVSDIAGSPSVSSIKAKTDQIAAAEGITSSNAYFVGRTPTNTAQDCTAKSFSNLSAVDGVCPEAATRRGGYNMVGIAAYAHSTDLRSDIVGSQKLTTYGVALAPELPKVTVQVPGQEGKTVSIIPACRSYKSQNFPNNDSNLVGNCAVVNFRVVSQVLDQANKKITGTMYIAWEDSEQGSDYDLDVHGYISYVVDGNSNTVTITTELLNPAAGFTLGFGYVLSGTSQDGVHFHQGHKKFYFKDPTGTPDCSASQSTNHLELVAGPVIVKKGNGTESVTAHGGEIVSVGSDKTTATIGNKEYTLISYQAVTVTQTTSVDGCSYIGGTSSRNYNLGSSSGQDLPKALKLASKWGGFTDANKDGIPQPEEWKDNYFATNNPNELAAALGKVFAVVSTSRSGSSVSVTSSTIANSTLAIASTYDPNDWSGDVLAYKVSLNGEINTNPTWRANQNLPSANARNILSFKPGSGSTPGSGIVFAWSQLSDSQKTLVGSADILNYLRGDTSKEDAPFRKRKFLLGDIVSSTPVYVGSGNQGYGQLPGTEGSSYGAYISGTKSASNWPTVYVGANDGMLHALNAANGEERFAYIPNAAMPVIPGIAASNIGSLSAKDYQHRFFVDATPTVGDAYLGGTWKTILLGAMGNGGNAVFAIDVTQPTSVGPTQVLWEFTDADLGYGVHSPLIVRTNSSTYPWVAVFGNGYSGSSKGPVLYIVDLASGTLVKKIVLDPTLASGADNGLSPPRAFDTNGDGTAEVIYAGDLKGNLWKIALPDQTHPNQWQTALGTSTAPAPLFIARDPANRVQAITTPPTVMTHPDKGLMVFFGTGRYLQADDHSEPFNGSPTDGTVTGQPFNPINTVYGIRDIDSAAVSGRSALLQQSILYEGKPDGFSSPIRIVSDHEIGTQPGWYLDLLSAGSKFEGERVIVEPLLAFDRLTLVTAIPTGSDCTRSGTGWLMDLGALNGGQLAYSAIDFSGDGKIGAGDIPFSSGEFAAMPASGSKISAGMPTGLTRASCTNPKCSTSGKLYIRTDEAKIIDLGESGPPGTKGRLNWRQIQ